MSDTDSTASKVGAMTTSLVEAGTYYFGIGKNRKETELTKVNLMDFDLSSSEGYYEAKLKENGSFNGEPQAYEGFDFETLSNNAEDEEVSKIYDYFANRAPSHTNSYTGIMKDYNVIFICAEGFWTYGIDEKVTPTLYKMSNEGIVLNNYYNSFRNTTVNGEFAFSTGLWPDVSRTADSGVDVGSMPQSSTKFMPVGLGKIFEKEGIPSYAFHNYYGDYYRRRFSWKNLGYENIYFMDEGMTFSTKWPASDYEMMQQSVEKYIDEDRFFTYYMTFSGHGPYNSKNCIYRKNIDEVKARLGEDAANYSSEAMGYLAGSLELEYGMEYLLEKLDEKDL
ncbi:MAG: sulfatase-like hydrolase/transferase, partial [Lachnospiraceae bacterium]|nr:sulfatase-like hydrolase/transferase [Lachnospiraceae bacterium]